MGQFGRKEIQLLWSNKSLVAIQSKLWKSRLVGRELQQVRIAVNRWIELERFSEKYQVCWGLSGSRLEERVVSLERKSSSNGESI